MDGGFEEAMEEAELELGRTKDSKDGGMGRNDMA